jgi:hypothetical protein
MSSDKALVKEEAKRLARGQGDDAIITLSTGVRVRLNPVSSSLVEDMKNVIKMPPVPVVWIEAKEREEENPNDPAYIDAVREVESKRASAVLDALCMFGVELEEGLPEDTVWIKKLRVLERRTALDLSDFDLEDDFDLEFLYKRYVAVAGADLAIVGGLHGMRPLEVARARATFLDHQGRDSDRGISDEELSQDEHRDVGGDA